MSVKDIAKAWEAAVEGNELLLLLALSDYANDIKRSLLKKMIEKLKIVENIEDMTDVEDIKELIKEQS